MKHLKSYKIFESVGQDLSDIFLEVNDELLWKVECWFENHRSDSKDGKWVVVIQTVDEDEEYELEGQNLPPVVIESIERAIDFMNGEGFTNYGITFEMEEDDQEEPELLQYKRININALSDLDVWPNNFIRIEFWK
jgi:hypothetical protein